MNCKTDNSASTSVQENSSPIKPSLGKTKDLAVVRGLGEADIEITIKNGIPSTYYMIGSFGDQVFKADSAQLINGTLRFQQPEAYAQGHYYVTMPSNSNFQMILGENQKFKISFDANNIANTLQSDDLENKLLYETARQEAALAPQFEAVRAKISGFAPGTTEYLAAQEEQNELLRQRKSILQKVFDENPNSLFAKFKKAGQNPDPRMDLDETARVVAYRQDMWNDVDFSDTRLLMTPVIANKMKRYMMELTVQHPDSIVASGIWLIDKSLPYPKYFQYFSNWLPLNYEPTKTTLMDPEKVYVKIIQRYFTFEHAFWADSTVIYGLQRRANEMAGSLVGEKANDVVANDPNGNSRSIYELKQDYIIVYMFSPDCEHCREETPKLINWYNTKKTFTYEVFGIGVNTDNEQWRKYVESSKMPWINVYDSTNRAIYGKYFVDITPEMYVLNPDRIIIAKNIKSHQIDEVIKRDRAN